MRISFEPLISVFSSAAFAAAALVAVPSHAATGDLYAATGGGGGAGFCSGGTLSSLYTIDPTTAAATLVGPIEIDDVQIRHVSALAFHPSTGVLYGVMNGQLVDEECDEATLLTIDPATGAATIVGTKGAILGPIPDITFDPYGTLYGWSEFGDQLYVIDITTGTATQVDSTDFGTRQTGLASDSQGRLWVKSAEFLTRINQYTAETFSGGSIPHSAHDMLAFDQNDVMFSAERITGGLTLFTIDHLDTFDTTDIGSNNVPNISALTFDRGVVTPPPVSDLSVSKQADDSSPEQGTQVVFTLTVDNVGPDAADNVVVSDALPTNFAFVSASGDGTYDDNTGEWSISSVAASSSASIEITVDAVFPGEYVNAATIVASDSYDPDSVIGSGDVQSDIYAEVSDEVLRPVHFSIDRQSPRLWVFDPTFETISFDHAQEIQLEGEEVCGGHGLARQPETAELFAVLQTDGCATRTLVTIDPGTADATAIGDFGSVVIGDIAFGGDQETLWATSENEANASGTLYSVDPADATLTALCVMPESDFGRALAYHDGRLYEAAEVCGGINGCVVEIRIIDTTDFPADPADPCPVVQSIQTSLSREPSGLMFNRAGADFVKFWMSTTDGEVYELHVEEAGFGFASTNFNQYLSHSSGGLASVLAGVLVGNLDTSKSATRDRVKGDKFITYTLEARNNGPDDLNGIVLSDELPAGTVVTSLGSGCSEAGGVVTCEAGFVEAQTSELYSFTVQVLCKKCSSINNTVSIRTDSDAYESPLDNTWQISTSLKGKF